MSGARGTVLGQVRGNARLGLLSSQAEVPLQLADAGELIIAQGLPTEAELARLGLIQGVVGTAVTPVVAVPTTAAHFSLFNANSDRSLIIHSVGALESVSSAAAGQMTVLARNDVPGANANPLGTLPIFCTNGQNYGGRANAKASVTLAAIAANNNVGWIPAGPSVVRTTTTGVGLCAHHEVNGRWIVPPNGMFSLAIIAQTAVGSVLPYAYFSEMILNNP